jgi:hypothetical protein
MAVAGALVARERHQLLKLFLALQTAGMITGAAFALVNSYNLLAGVGWGLGVSSVNFSVCLLSSKDKSSQL